MSYRTRIALFVLGGLLLLFAADTAYEALNTLRQLDAIEAERDNWQRAADILGALNLRNGDTVVDLGSGAGFFALKLSTTVGPSGRVQAVDIRRLPLFFLWMRTIQKHRTNVTTILSKPDVPRLPSNSANAVLIANTYHEFTDPRAILTSVFQSLRSGGRLVMTDPATAEHGNNPLEAPERELRRIGFDIVSEDARFLEQPDRGSWWLVVARKP